MMPDAVLGLLFISSLEPQNAQCPSTTQPSDFTSSQDLTCTSALTIAAAGANAAGGNLRRHAELAWPRDGDGYITYGLWPASPRSLDGVLRSS